MSINIEMEQTRDKLSRIFNVEKGVNAQELTKEFIGQNPGPYPVYSGQTENEGIVGTINRYDYETNSPVILVTTVGAKAMTTRLINGKFSLSQNCAILQFNFNYKNYDIRFVEYSLTELFRTERDMIAQIMQPSFRVEDLTRLYIPTPSIQHQKQIADFLDKETTRIDTLISKKQKQIELLNEKRKAIITQAVTKGLNPDVKMKDSGVEWIGEIPEHWGIVKIRHLTLVKRGSSPRPIDDPIYFDEEGKYSWVRIADVTASSKYLETTTQKLSELGSNLSVKLEPGKLFLSIAGSVGKPIITKINCCIHDGFVYFPYFEENNEFLYYIFLSGEPFGGLGKMGTQLNLNTDTVGDIKIPLPPGEEQDYIVEYLIDEVEKNQLLIEKIQKSIELLKEYRSSLITHAVSGQIDIAEYAKGTKREEAE